MKRASFAITLALALGFAVALAFGSAKGPGPVGGCEGCAWFAVEQPDPVDFLAQAFDDACIEPRLLMPSRFAPCDDAPNEMCAMQWVLAGRRVTGQPPDCP